MTNFVYLRRLSDGKIVDIPKEHLDMTLKRGGFEKVSDMPGRAAAEAPVIKSFSPTKCILCGFEAPDISELRLHRINTHQ